jgi:hypothetical protein
MKVRSPKSEFRSFFAAFVAVVIAVSVQAATNSATNDEFVLRPPYQEMPPTYWEQHGNAVILLSVLGVIVLGLLVCFLLRSRTKMLVPVEVHVRSELESLRQRPEDGRVLSAVSRGVQRYFAAAFDMPAGELTTAEFSRFASADEKIGKELASTTEAFLRRCDEMKFAPGVPTELKAVDKAFGLIAQADARKQQSLAAATSKS